MKIMNPYTFIFQKESQLPIQLKYGLTKSGGCVVANNNSKIPNKELNAILEIISSNYFKIVSEWKIYFDKKDVKFYC